MLKRRGNYCLNDYPWILLSITLFLWFINACATGVIEEPGSPSINAETTILKAQQMGAEDYAPFYLEAAKKDLEKARKSSREDKAADFALRAYLQAQISLAQCEEHLIKKEISQIEGQILEFRLAKERYNKEEAQINALLAQLEAKTAQLEIAQRKAGGGEKRVSLTYDQVTQFVEGYLSQILFEPNQATLSLAAMQNLAGLANFLKENPGVKIAVYGFSSKEGPKDYNMKLSKDRADTVAQFLVSTGVSSDQIAVVMGYGNTMPAISNSTEIGKKLNRRVEIEILETERNHDIGANNPF